MSASVFKAIANPSRREIISLISTEGSIKYTDVARHFNMSRQAVSKHLGILESAGLIEVKKNSREKICTPKLENLKTANDWLQEYSRFWSNTVDRLDDHLNKS